MKKKLGYLGYFWLIFKGDTNIYIYIYMMKENPFKTNTSANFGKKTSLACQQPRIIKATSSSCKTNTAPTAS